MRNYLAEAILQNLPRPVGLRYGGMEVDEVRKVRALEEENGRLKRVVADQAVQIQILKEVNAKKW